MLRIFAMMHPDSTFWRTQQGRVRAEAENASDESTDVYFSVPRDKRPTWSRAIDEFVSGHEDATTDSEQRS
ncbi:MAG: hypothetical protein U0936_12065 [Planctomycetaceae bacterium]